MDTSPTQHRSLPPSAYHRMWVTAVTVAFLLGCAAMLLTLGPILSLLVLGTFYALGAVLGLAADVPGIPHPVQTLATISTCAAVTVFGITRAPWVVGPTVLFLVALAPHALRFAARAVVRQPAVCPAGAAFADPMPEFTALLRTLDKDGLQDVWQSSALALERARGHDAVSEVVKIRQLCLDELERSDPETFDLWLLTQYPS